MPGSFKARDLVNYRKWPNSLSQIGKSKVSIIPSFGVCYLLGHVSLLARPFWAHIKVHAQQQCKLSSVINQVADGYMIKRVCNVPSVAGIYTSQTLLF